LRKQREERTYERGTEDGVADAEMKGGGSPSFTLWVSRTRVTVSFLHETPVALALWRVSSPNVCASATPECLRVSRPRVSSSYETTAKAQDDGREGVKAGGAGAEEG
jgi:hypothetical protein